MKKYENFCASLTNMKEIYLTGLVGLSEKK